MSYTFLQAQEEESLVECFSDIPACALSRLSPIAGASCFNGSGTESCRAFRSGMMSAPSTALLGQGELMLFAPEYPARKSLEQIERLTHPDFFSRITTPPLSVSFAKFDRHCSFWKTAISSSTAASKAYSGTWPKWGMMRRGESWALDPLISHTKDTASGSWPTPTATDYKGGTAAIRKDTGRVRMDLVRHVCKVLFGLTYPIPEHSEALMGWPIGWTDLRQSATDKFQQWLHSHGESLSETPTD